LKPKRIVIVLVVVSVIVAVAMFGIVGFFTYASMHGTTLAVPGGLTPWIVLLIAAFGTAMIGSWARRRRRR
jgi:hypothetical protein